MTLGIWFGQFNITGGQVEEEGPFVGIFEGARQAAGVGVYVVAEPVSGAPARLCNEVLEVIARAFGNPEAALTANLLRAVAAAHDHVRAYNRLRPGDRAAGVGLSLIATRGDEAYLAQCGPSLVIAHVGGRFRVAAPAGDDSRRPLGFGEKAAPVFTRLSLHPEDVMLLTFSAADRMLGRGTLINLANSAPEDALPDLYLRARGADNFAALYLGVIEQPVPAETVQRGRPGATPARPAGGTGRARAAAPATGDTYNPEQEWARAPDGGYPVSRPVPVGSMRERMAQTATISRQAAQQALASLSQGGWQPSRRTLYLMIAVIGLVLVLIVAVPALAERGADDRYAGLIKRAADTVTLARQEADAGRRRSLLNQAEADLIEAKAMRATSTDADDLLEAVGEQRTALDGIRQLPEPVILADLSAAGIASASMVEVAIAGRIFVLDGSAGKVLAFEARSGQPPETVYEEGRTLAGTKAAKARHLTVLPDARGGPGTLLVLDANRKLFALPAAGDWQLVPMGDTQVWKSDTGIAAVAGALYALDVTANQVWRLDGDLAGYEEPPEPLIARPNLKDAAAISVSATPMVATTTGRLLRVIDGKEQDFAIAGLDRPLTAPFAPIFNPADGQVYIPDRGNGRIVVAGTDGTFKGQLVQRRLGGLRALGFDAEQGVFYAVSGSNLFLFPLER